MAKVLTVLTHSHDSHVIDGSNDIYWLCPLNRVYSYPLMRIKHVWLTLAHISWLVVNEPPYNTLVIKAHHPHSYDWERQKTNKQYLLESC